MVEAESALSALGTPHRFRVEAYHRMLEVGILHEDDHVELLEGVIVRMSPQGVEHARAIARLTRLLVQALGDGYSVRPQLPLALGEDSELEPDVAVVPAESESEAEHPRHALLVVEVASESLAQDRGVKARLYARAGIPEYWIVDVKRRRVEVYRDPDMSEGRFRSSITVDGGEKLECQSLSQVQVIVNQIFG